MNYIDVILIVPLLWGILRGIKKGIVKELTSFIALIFGIYGAINFAVYIQPFLKSQFEIGSSLIPIVSFAVTFLIIVLSIKLIGFIIDKIVKFIALGIISRLLGGVFGLLKAAFILSGLLLILNAFDNYLNLLPAKQKKQSILHRPISNIIPSILIEINGGKKLIKETNKLLDNFNDNINL